MPQSVSEFLNTPYELSADQIAYFRENGFIKLKQVLSKEVIEYMDLIITEEVNRLRAGKEKNYSHCHRRKSRFNVCHVSSV